MNNEDWSWLEARRDELHTASVETVTSALNEGLAKIDERLEAQVEDEGGTRRVTISANRKAGAFDLVRRLVASAPSFPRWRFVALRQGRGFEFEFEAGGRRLDARALAFVGKPGDDGLKVRLLVPNPEFEGWPEIAWQIIEAGIGEEAAAQISVLEVGTRDDEDNQNEHVLALESLGGYIKRRS